MIDVWFHTPVKAYSFVVDDYESFIWTERYNTAGDFKMVVKGTHTCLDTLLMFGRIMKNVIVAIDGSTYRMFVETVELSEGKATISGRSYESVLSRRTTMIPYGPRGDTDSTYNNMKPGAALIEAVKFLGDNFGTTYPIEDPTYGVNIYTFYESTTSPTTIPKIEKFKAGSLYDAVTSFADSYSLGWRFEFPATPTPGGKPGFRVYDGDDRTSTQNTFKKVIFNEGSGDLVSVTLIYSSADYYNGAFVCAKNGEEHWVDPSILIPPTLLDLYELPVDATDIETAAGTTLTDKLDSRASKEVLKKPLIAAVDGEVSPVTTYKYREDYYLGDIVEFRSIRNTTSKLRVTEHIFSSDKEGNKSYPTLEAIEA